MKHNEIQDILKRSWSLKIPEVIFCFPQIYQPMTNRASTINSAIKTGKRHIKPQSIIFNLQNISCLLTQAPFGFDSSRTHARLWISSVSIRFCQTLRRSETKIARYPITHTLTAVDFRLTELSFGHCMTLPFIDHQPPHSFCKQFAKPWSKSVTIVLFSRSSLSHSQPCPPLSSSRSPGAELGRNKQSHHISSACLAGGITSLLISFSKGICCRTFPISLSSEESNSLHTGLYVKPPWWLQCFLLSHV